MIRKILFFLIPVLFVIALVFTRANSASAAFSCSGGCLSCSGGSQTCWMCCGPPFTCATWSNPCGASQTPPPTPAPTPPPPPPPPSCPGSGVPSSGWGGSCSPGAQTKLACDGPSHCSVAACQQYSGSTYCWYNSGTCYNDPAACNSVNPPQCRQITCGGDPGAGGTCNYPNSPNVNVGSCTYTCTYPFGPPSYVPGHTISVCQSNNCYDNSCQCYPNNPCPPCPTITCNGNSGAGGTCNYPNSPNVNIPGCTYTCPGSTKTVPGHTISVCQSNNCYNNDCAQCYPDDPNACKTGTTKTVEICDNNGKWVQQNPSSCVANSSCVAGTATPTPTPLPNCTSNPACGSCKWACGQGNSRDCQYTQPQPCNPVPGFVDTGGCASSCPSNFNCVSNSCQPSLSITGNVFVDVNVDTLKNAGESNYTGAATFQLNTGTSANAANGAYTFTQLLSGTYTVNYTNPPTGAGGFSMTYPLNGPPPSLTVSVGSGNCSPDPGGHWGCDANGSVTNLNFGISNNKPWIQCKGADCRIDGGFTSEVPATAIGGAYANLNGSGGSPGLIFTGNSTPNFGQGQASTTGWVVGGPTYGELYAPIRIGGIVKTSYNYVSAKASAGSITPTDLAPHCSGGLGNCTLTLGLNSHGVYRANGDVTLNAFTFPAGQNFVILINGNLTIRGKILVPNGSTALFSASGNINIDKTLGEAASSTTPTIEGIYSADRSFVVQGYGGCTVQADFRFNVAGSVIANAALAGGSFQNQRDLCANDIYYPTIYFTERLDMVLNTPDFLKAPNFTYQEIAP